MQVSIVGITGYSGLELLRILQGHPQAEVVSIHASSSIGRPLSALYPHLRGSCELKIEEFNSRKIMQQSDLVFFAAPSGVAKDLVKDFVEADFPVIDLSGDYRLPADIYKEWYQKEAGEAAVQECFTYGLAEFADVAGKKFIANPGCYATAAELALIPLLQAQILEPDSIIIDAKSGLTGAGKKPAASSHFVQVHDNYVTYKLNRHQHIPEILQELQLFDDRIQQIQFSTSLLPLNRGIVATVYSRLKKPLSAAEISSIYRRSYNGKPFVRLQASLPSLHQVIGSNYTDIGFDYNPATNVLTVVAVIDNLVKGAAGQAVQNMNLMLGWDERAGLLSQPAYV
ncbi:N-acetyl-gamma-glutamyl-phosphate reductase [Streptococcus panodentis]|uniref:N-acetyl-gamma-glutamyl-phosphate reductase n=1 Tax=Streptococcus panodentis TaxID=1581472 RepID=A0ABS5AUC7_9STRE|nr:N-acetyl-gamma-glutamyl-phosphate reductase [Streptococcus panodentis]MBP2620168.1 N-acetyl-gamma-glutamyl-phosphate reductase [Streptococcus panodentis]